jgi:signal recognition particle subunit SRP54
MDPGRLAGRILQQGDVVGLVERAQLAVDRDESEKLQAKVLGDGRFSLEDFLTALTQVQRMGPLEQLVKLIPGMSSRLPAAATDPRRMKHVEAIILSMTPDERRRPEVLNGSRRSRIAKGSGRPVSEVNRLMKQFREMKKMMKQLKGMRGMLGTSGMMPR